MTLRKAFALFLCALMMTYIFVGPGLFKKYNVQQSEMDQLKKKVSSWNGVITLWDFPRLDNRTGLRFSWIKKNIQAFEKAHPGVYIEFRELDWQDGPLLLKAAAQTGANPDIAPVGDDFFYLSKGVLEPLDDTLSLADKEDYLESALKAVTYKDKIYGLPWMMTGYTMVLNTDMFNEKNVPLPQDGNWTYEQFIDAAKKLTYDTNRKGGPDVYGFNSFIEAGSYNLFGILLCDGAQIIDEQTGKYTFFDPTALSGLKKLCELKTLGVTPPDFGKMSEKQAWSAFLNGKTAMYTAGSWTVPYIRSQQDKQGLNFTVANFPTGKVEMPVTLCKNISAYSVFKQKDDAKREMCFEFIKFLTGKDHQNDLVDFGYFPVRKSAKHLYERDKEMYTIQQNLSFSEALPRVADWSDIDLILQARIRSAVLGEMTPEQALEDARQVIESRRQ